MPNDDKRSERVHRDDLAAFVTRMARDERMFIYSIIPDDERGFYRVDLAPRPDLETRGVA